MFLADFSVIKPDFGLFFWSCLIFVLFWTLIGRFAFRPIAEALKKREDDIQGALDEAVKTREEMAKMKAQMKHCWPKHGRKKPYAERSKGNEGFYY